MRMQTRLQTCPTPFPAHLSWKPHWRLQTEHWTWKLLTFSECCRKFGDVLPRYARQKELRVTFSIRGARCRHGCTTRTIERKGTANSLQPGECYEEAWSNAILNATKRGYAHLASATGFFGDARGSHTKIPQLLPDYTSILVGITSKKCAA